MSDLVAYDAATPPLAAILASDAVAVCCYTDGKYAYQPGWIAEIANAGKGVLANHENAVNEFLGGYLAGVHAAQLAMDAVAKWPVKVPAIYYSVDCSVDPSSKDFEAARQYFYGIKDAQLGAYKSGTYAEGALIDNLATSGLTDVAGWLSGSTSFPGYDRTSPFVGMYQLVGSDIAGTDKNIITNLSGMGFWLPPLPPVGNMDNLTVYTNNTAGDPEENASFADFGGGYAPGLSTLQYQTIQNGGLGKVVVEYVGQDAQTWRRNRAMLNQCVPANAHVLPGE